MKTFLQILICFLLVIQICYAQWAQTNGLKDQQVPHHPLIGTKVFKEIPRGLSGLPTQNRMQAAFINDEPSPAWMSHYIDPTEPSQSQYNAIAFDRKGNVYAGQYCVTDSVSRFWELCTARFSGAALIHGIEVQS